MKAFFMKFPHVFFFIHGALYAFLPIYSSAERFYRSLQARVKLPNFFSYKLFN
jgi:hypothetical protein